VNQIRLENLSLPCPVNRLWRAIPMRVGRRVIGKNVLSKEAREKSKRMVIEMRQRMGGAGPSWPAAQVEIVWTPATRRCCDVDAYEKQTLDALAKAGVVLDDKDVVSVRSDRMDTAKRPGCMTVIITEVPGKDET
jgi:Holliday junction resolvase RusA-like endonuclease